MIIRNLTKQTILAENAVAAISFSARLRGMIGRKFNGFDALVFDRCSSIHMLFMTMPLDIVFISRENRILGAYRSVRPWLPALAVPGARAVLELPAGALERSGTEAGDYLDLQISLLNPLEKIKKQAIFPLTAKNISFTEKND